MCWLVIASIKKLEWIPIFYQTEIKSNYKKNMEMGKEKLLRLIVKIIEKYFYD